MTQFLSTNWLWLVLGGAFVWLHAGGHGHGTHSHGSHPAPVRVPSTRPHDRKADDDGHYRHTTHST